MKESSKELNKKSDDRSTEAKEHNDKNGLTDKKAEALAALLRSMNLITAPQQEKSLSKSTMDDFKFWSTQPVPKLNELVEKDGPIESNKPHDEIRQDPYPLPSGYEWCTIDLENEKAIRDVYELLNLNYVEDDDAMFRFDYSVDFLKWALKPPGWKSDWHVGVRVSTTKKLIGFISGIPADMKLKSSHQTLVEINFLCVHKKLRSKRLAPVLIKEVTRRVHLKGIFQAVYTAGTFLPKPVTSCRYYHRNMNPKKLIDTGFSSLGRNMTLSRTIKFYKLAQAPLLEGIREMRLEDVPQVTKLYNKYMSKFYLRPEMTEEEVTHWMLPREKVVYTYVVENASKKVIEFVSFYSLPSTVINHPNHSHIYAAYLFYYAPRDHQNATDSLQRLMMDALILASQNGFDVFNCLDIMDNKEFLDDLKFGRGDGTLHYYLYNYRLNNVEPENLGLVMM